MKDFLWYTLLCQIFISCAPVPYFYKVIVKPHISGTLVNQDSITPVRGAIVEYRNKKIITDSSGRFEFEPKYDYRYWCLFVIAPFDRLLLNKNIKPEVDSLSTSNSGRFRSTIFIESYPPNRSCLEINKEFKKYSRTDMGKVILYKIED